MPEWVLAEARLNSTSRSIEPSRSAGSKPSNGSGTHARRCQHLAGEGHVQRAVARLGERVGDGEVGDRGGEEDGAVGLLRPQVAVDVRRLAGVGDVGDQRPHARRVRAVQLADEERGPVAAQDAARPHHVGAEVHERAHHPLAADRRGDHVLVEPVLERDDEAVGRRAAGPPSPSPSAVWCDLTASSTASSPPGSGVRHDRRRPHVQLLDRPLDAQAVGVDRRHVLRVGVAEEYVVSVADEPGGNRAADRPGPDDGIPHGPILPGSTVRIGGSHM